tara:strand:- start:68 stop:1567 length:1500 start_codon:yes stop_codon:yes gene_type:complete
MFKYQDMIRLKEVEDVWYSPVKEAFSAILEKYINDVALFAKIENALGKEVVDRTLTLDDEHPSYIFRGTIASNDANSNRNRTFHKGQMDLLRKWGWGIDVFPVQYDLSEWFKKLEGESVEMMTERGQNFIESIKEWDIFSKIEILTDLLEGVETTNGQVWFDRIKGASESLERDLVEYLEPERVKFVEMIKEQNWLFSMPPYKNMWLDLGIIPEEDEEIQGCKQGVQVVTYNADEWDKCTFGNSVTQEQKFDIAEDEYVIKFADVTLDKYGSTGFSGVLSFVHLDKNHQPIDYYSNFNDLDLLLQQLAIGSTVAQRLSHDDRYRIDTDGKQRDDFEEKHLLQMNVGGLYNVYQEANFAMNRVYYLLELFCLLNTKNTEYPNQKIYTEDKASTISDKKAKNFSKKYGKDIEQQRLVMKTLSINPLMSGMFADGQVPSAFADGLFKVREHRRAGHTKTYTADKPRFGVYHPNNIGTFPYKSTTVAKNSKKGTVIKDYKVEL